MTNLTEKERELYLELIKSKEENDRLRSVIADKDEYIESLLAKNTDLKDGGF